MKSFKDNGLVTQKSGFNSHPPTDRRLQHLSDRAKRLEAQGASVRQTSPGTSRLTDSAGRSKSTVKSGAKKKDGESA